MAALARQVARHRVEHQARQAEPALLKWTRLVTSGVTDLRDGTFDGHLFASSGGRGARQSR
jgi:hypothetical protein